MNINYWDVSCAGFKIVKETKRMCIAKSIRERNGNILEDLEKLEDATGAAIFNLKGDYVWLSR